jgi:hypothetical protein
MATQSDSPTVQVLSHSDEEVRSSAALTQLSEILTRVEVNPEVEQHATRLAAASDALRQYRRAQSSLVVRIGELNNAAARQSEQAEMRLTHGDSLGEEVTVLIHLEAQHRLMTRANRRLLERLIPEAEITEMLASADHLLAKGRALRAEAAARIEKTAKLMAEAAQFEGNIVFDPTQTLSGALLAEAEQLERQADTHRRWAAERAEKHQQTLRELDALNLNA